MNHKARQTIEEYNMLRPGDRVVVGVSGGADSVALLCFLEGLAHKMGLSLSVCHMNHSLRGEESDRDQSFVEALCKAKNISCKVKKLNIAEMALKSGLSIEESARRERYLFFEEVALPIGAKIATAHTLSDSIETMLLNLLRGTGLAGLCGIPPVRGSVIRPLIRCSREEIEAYCRRERLDYVTDSTNLENDYTRNQLRHQVIPVFKEMNPSFETVAGRAIDLLSADRVLLEEMTSASLNKIKKGQALERDGFLQLDRALQKRVLALFLEGEGYSRDNKRIEDMLKFARQGSGGVPLAADAAFSCDSETLYIKKAHRSQPFFEQEVLLEKVFFEKVTYECPIICGKTVVLTVTGYEYFEKTANLEKNQFKNCLDYDRIDEIVRIRQRQEGDCLSLPDRKLTKLVRKLFNEAKLPIEERARRLLLADSGGVLWVEGFGTDLRCQVTKETRRILSIRVLEDF
ncbi:tRNA lysidine(34) synthetase TilS [Oscillospiraceae bacterium MB08-C2-2]|nr:tRNA lysidine(34) synthetase TilS [Oscillospiraceae bacterium MB08-C2-2]